MYAVYTAALAAAVTGYAPVAVARRVIRGVPLHLRERLGFGRQERIADAVRMDPRGVGGRGDRGRARSWRGCGARGRRCPSW